MMILDNYHLLSLSPLPSFHHGPLAGLHKQNRRAVGSATCGLGLYTSDDQFWYFTENLLVVTPFGHSGLPMRHSTLFDPLLTLQDSYKHMYCYQVRSLMGRDNIKTVSNETSALTKQNSFYFLKPNTIFWYRICLNQCASESVSPPWLATFNPAHWNKTLCPVHKQHCT